MAIGFGTTRGSASTDRIAGPSEAVPNQCSILVRAWRRSGASAGYWRILSRSVGVFDIGDYSVLQTNTFFFGNVNSNPVWYWTRPAADQWFNLSISVDVTASSNDPIIYQDGSKLTVGSGLTQVGTDQTWQTGATGWCVGNRPSDNARVWEGDIADFAIYNAILTDDEHYAFNKGVSPLLIRPDALLHYLPMIRNGSVNRVDAPWTVTGTGVQSHPKIILPRGSGILKYAAAAGGGSNLPVFRNHYINQGFA